jgi:hypothetical protein
MDWFFSCNALMFNVQKTPYGTSNQRLKNEGLPTSYKEQVVTLNYVKKCTTCTF